MREGYQALTEKEKQVLRLLVGGHDAKSAARHLELSVHTVNERLRDARRKMGTSSSREAARLASMHESSTPQFHVDKQLGDAGVASAAQDDSRSRQPRRSRWIIGAGIMTVIFALFALALSPGAPPADDAHQTISADEAEAIESAREWLALVDAGDWQSSYDRTGASFRRMNSPEQWKSAAQSAHGSLGPALSRAMIAVDYSPAPPNGVWTIRFRTRFSNQREAIETVALAHEDNGWRVVGVMLD